MRDVVVVGGGPAGSVTALLLARAGRDVMLLDQRAFPRAKACGDCISPGANAILERLGVLDRVLAARPAHLEGWQLSAGDATFRSTFGGGCVSYAMERARLDAILLEAAREAGVDVHNGARVTDLERKGERVAGVIATLDGERVPIFSHLTVGADGLRSRVARRLSAHRRPPRLRKVSLTAHLRGIPNVHAMGEMHVRPHACLGVAPVEPGENPLCNVTVVMSSDSIGKSTHGHSTPATLLRDALARFPGRDLSSLVTDATTVLASGPFDWPVRRVVYEGAALVGDAAGYYDPFTGQGIYQALAGAELLAHHVINENLGAFDAAYRALLAPVRRVQRGVELVCSRPFLAHTAFRALARSPRVARRLIEVTGDLRPARDLLWFSA